ncbi:hypothetical protein ACWGA0_08070 [Streptomyces erythrochromogenes]
MINEDMPHTALRRRANVESVEGIQPDLLIPTGTDNIKVLDDDEFLLRLGSRLLSGPAHGGARQATDTDGKAHGGPDRAFRPGRSHPSDQTPKSVTIPDRPEA